MGFDYNNGPGAVPAPAMTPEEIARYIAQQNAAFGYSGLSGVSPAQNPAPVAAPAAFNPGLSYNQPGGPGYVAPAPAPAPAPVNALGPNSVSAFQNAVNSYKPRSSFGRFGQRLAENARNKPGGGGGGFNGTMAN